MSSQTKAVTQSSGGGTVSVVGLVVAIIAIFISLSVGAYLISALNAAMPAPTNAALNQSVQNLNTQIGNAFNLVAIVPIILVITVIIAMIIGWGRSA